MSSYSFPTGGGGLRLKYGFWDIGLWMQDDFGAGPMFVLGYDDPGAGWTMVGPPIDGPYDQALWEQIMRNSGGMGNYAFAKLPIIQAALHKFFDTKPVLPVETNATPFTVSDFNDVWAEYFDMVAPIGQTYPMIVRKT